MYSKSECVSTMLMKNKCVIRKIRWSLWSFSNEQCPSKFTFFLRRFSVFFFFFLFFFFYPSHATNNFDFFFFYPSRATNNFDLSKCITPLPFNQSEKSLASLIHRYTFGRYKPPLWYHFYSRHSVEYNVHFEKLVNLFLKVKINVRKLH